jgi:hypothetical protein
LTRILTTLLPVLGAAALVLSASTPAAAVGTVSGELSPSSISLRAGGKAVKTLQAGVPYRFSIRDRSDELDFRLAGPGLNRLLTRGNGGGVHSTTLRLARGAYRYQASCVSPTVLCRILAKTLTGTFRVG